MVSNGDVAIGFRLEDCGKIAVPTLFVVQVGPWGRRALWCIAEVWRIIRKVVGKDFFHDSSWIAVLLLLSTYYWHQFAKVYYTNVYGQ